MQEYLLDMKVISHSEACSYWACQKKWWLTYIKGIKPTSIHLDFGSMAHKVLETRELPDEILYPDLKEAFNITSWKNYFTNIFEILDEMLSDYEVLDRELKITHANVVGVIDLVLKHKQTGEILLLDYKFKSAPMTYEDLFLDEQLKIYAKLYSAEKWLSVEDISVGYVNIPKTEIKEPKLLKNGSLSKDKSQMTTKKKYLDAIKKHNLNESDYEDILKDLECKPYISIIKSSVDEKVVDKIFENLHNTIKSIESGIVLECMSQNICKNCDYKHICKY